MSEILNALRADLATALEGLDVGPVVTDPAKIRTPCILVGLPTVRRINTMDPSRIEVDITVYLVAPGPGNEQAVEWLHTRLVPVMQALRCLTATPGTYEVGDRTFVTYDLDLNRALTIEEGS